MLGRFEINPVTGLDTASLRKRSDVCEAAEAKHSERRRGTTRNWQPILVVQMNLANYTAKQGSNIQNLKKPLEI